MSDTTETLKKFVESSVVQCKICNETKIRFQKGKWNKVDKRWIDERGKAWNGKTCPDCHVLRMKLRKAEKKKAKDAAPTDETQSTG